MPFAANAAGQSYNVLIEDKDGIIQCMGRATKLEFFRDNMEVRNIGGAPFAIAAAPTVKLEFKISSENLVHNLAHKFQFSTQLIDRLQKRIVDLESELAHYRKLFTRPKIKKLRRVL